MKTIQVSDENHKEIKHLATDKGCSIMNIVNDLLIEHSGRLKEDWNEPKEKRVS